MSAPAAAYTPPVDQPPPSAVAELPYGGFWVRFAAHFVDGFIIGIAMVVITVVWALVTSFQSAVATNDLLGLVMLVVGQVYHAYFVSSAKMATPGKRLCGLYVTDLEGHRLSFGRALWRNVAALFSYLTLYIGFIMAGFTERKQALHDKIAGTLVHRQPGSSAAIVIVIVLVLFFGVAVIGILAAIALPAFQDYSVRAKMSEVIASMDAVKTPIAEYAANKGQWPTTWEQVESAGGTNPMRRVTENTRALVEDIRLEQGGAVVSTVKIQGKQGQIRLTPRQAGDQVEWTCTSSPEIRKYVPVACRE
ncbi:MAG: hypothetical protein HW398_931 [Acidobacteria bacterium]|nr:hypothetical protein [Acidobacteriota bacterium]